MCTQEAMVHFEFIAEMGPNARVFSYVGSFLNIYSTMQIRQCPGFFFISLPFLACEIKIKYNFGLCIIGILFLNFRY